MSKRCLTLIDEVSIKIDAYERDIGVSIIYDISTSHEDKKTTVSLKLIPLSYNFSISLITL